ncbi:MAG: esterase/lipase family protein [Phycisphaerales bacterium]
MPSPSPRDRLASLLEHASRPFARAEVNPDFDIPRERLARERRRLRANPVPLARPVVVVSGWRAPGMASRMTANRLAATTSHDTRDFIPVSLFDAASIAHAATSIIRAVDAERPADAEGAAEVDVVAISMGGLATRLAAAPRDALGDLAQRLPDRPLRVARLFTLATPHQGASLAEVVAPDACSRDMRPGSEFLRTLDRALERNPIDIVPYARLRDGMVGAQNAAPPNTNPLWVDGPPALAHLAITTDKRIMLDIALRLRGETPIASPGSPPPRQ